MTPAQESLKILLIVKITFNLRLLRFRSKSFAINVWFFSLYISSHCVYLILNNFISLFFFVNSI